MSEYVVSESYQEEEPAEVPAQALGGFILDELIVTEGDPQALQPQPRQVRTVRTRVSRQRQQKHGEFSYTEDPIRDYLDRIARHPLLNAEDEVRLSKQFEAGVFAYEKLQNESPEHPLSDTERVELRTLELEGEHAFHAMMESNLRLVVSIAKKYTGRGMDMLDLIQEGNAGLYRAVQKFDYQKGYKFSTYATWWIRQAVTRSLADQARTIRIPVHMVERINKVNRAHREIAVTGEEPTPEAIAAKTGYKLNDVNNLLRLDRPLASLNSKLEGDKGNDTELGDVIEDEHAGDPSDTVPATMLRNELLDILEKAIPNDRHRHMIMLRYGLNGSEPMTLEDVGKELGVTRERVRQIEVKYVGNQTKRGSFEAGALMQVVADRGLRAYLD